MSDENRTAKSFKEKMKDNYRFVVMNNETFEEVGSYKLSLLNVYILASTLAVIMAILILLLLVFTPLKRLIPGLASNVDQTELLLLNQKLDAIEKQAQIQKNYSDSFHKMLVGEAETMPLDEVEEVADDSIKEIARIKEDEMLRKEIELNELIEEKAALSRQVNFSPRDVPLEQLYFTPPVNGSISAGFMPDQKHYGADILAPKNTPIKAVLDGFVISSDWTVETGNTIGIQHSNNIITFYKHNSALLKEIGSYVKAGEAVAIIGNTGTLSTGPHLHFEIWHKGKPVDPASFVNFE